MKITSVDIIKSNDERCPGRSWKPIFVRVNTDEGIYGYGEAGVAYTTGAFAAAEMLVDYAQFILGMDPMKNEAIWNHLHRQTFWGMGGGTIVFAAMSAIDIALWDIRGKALGVPVYQLLGGKTNQKLHTYASQIQFGWGKEKFYCVKPEHYRKATRDAMNAGFDCVKVDPVGFDLEGNWMKWKITGALSRTQLEAAVERVAAIREEGGKDLGIIIELHSLTDTNTAIQLAKELEPLNIMYYEEPTQPLNPELYRHIAQKVNIPLASGERIYSRWGYRPFLEDRSLSFIQPDFCNCGGITEGKKICDMAHVYDIAVQGHVCGGPIATAAALQVEAVVPNFIIHELHQRAITPANIDLCVYNYQPVDGYYDVPDLPGIGQELSPKALELAEIYTVR